MKRRYFWAGFWVAAAANGLYQDVLGKERYLRLVRDHWTSPWISVPLEIGMLAWSAWWMRDTETTILYHRKAGYVTARPRSAINPSGSAE